MKTNYLRLLSYSFDRLSKLQLLLSLYIWYFKALSFNCRMPSNSCSNVNSFNSYRFVIFCRL